MCLTKDGESGKDCKGVVAQKDNGAEPVVALQHMQAVLYFIRSEIGSQWSCCRTVVQFLWRGALRIRRAAVFWDNLCLKMIKNRMKLNKPGRM